MSEMDYSKLSLKEKRIAETIENIYLNNTYINKKEFLNALFFIGNKHKK